MELTHIDLEASNFDEYNYILKFKYDKNKVLCAQIMGFIKMKKASRVKTKPSDTFHINRYILIKYENYFS